MGYGRAIAINSLWMIVGKMVTTILSLVVTAQLARALGVFGYGEFTTAFAFLTIFGVVADFGFYQILVREIAAKPGDEKSIANNVFSMRTLFAIVTYGIAAGIVWFFPYSYTVKMGVVILSLASFLLSINTTMIGVFQAHHQMYKAVIGDMVGRIVLFALVTYFLGTGWNLNLIFSLYLVTNLLNLIVTFYYLEKIAPVRFVYDRKQWGWLFKEALPMGIAAILGIMYFKTNMIILSILKPADDMGIYGAAFKIFELITIVPGIFMGNVFPAITKLLNESPGRVTRLIQGAFDALMILSVGTVFGLFATSGSVIRLVAGPEFLSASTISIFNHPVTSVEVEMILAVALLGIFLSSLWAPIIIALGHQKDLIKPGLAAVVISVVLNFAFIPRWSYAAAAMVTVVTEAFIAIVWGFIARKNLNFKLDYSRVFKAIIAGIAMIICIWPIRDLFILIPMIVGALVYCLALWFLGAIPKNFRQYLGFKVGEVG